MASAPLPTIRLVFDRKKQATETTPALIQIGSQEKSRQEIDDFFLFFGVDK